MLKKIIILITIFSMSLASAMNNGNNQNDENNLQTPPRNHMRFKNPETPQGRSPATYWKDVYQRLKSIGFSSLKRRALFANENTTDENRPETLLEKALTDSINKSRHFYITEGYVFSHSLDLNTTFHVNALTNMNKESEYNIFHYLIMLNSIEICNNLLSNLKEIIYSNNKEDGHKKLVSQISPNHGTPYHIAVDNKNFSLICWLTEHFKADLTATDEDWDPILHYAITKKSSEEIIGHLIHAGADINQRNCNDGNTALHIAMREKHYTAILLLARCKDSPPDMAMPNSRNYLPLHLFVMGPETEDSIAYLRIFMRIMRRTNNNQGTNLYIDAEDSQDRTVFDLLRLNNNRVLYGIIRYTRQWPVHRDSIPRGKRLVHLSWANSSRRRRN